MNRFVLQATRTFSRCCTGLDNPTKWRTTGNNAHALRVPPISDFQYFFFFSLFFPCQLWLFRFSGCARWDLNGFICTSIIAAGVLGKCSCFWSDLEGNKCSVCFKCHCLASWGDKLLIWRAKSKLWNFFYFPGRDWRVSWKKAPSECVKQLYDLSNSALEELCI